MTEFQDDPTPALNALYSLASEHPHLALERMAVEDIVYANNLHYLAFRPGILINAATALGDARLIRQGIHSIADVLKIGDPRIRTWRTNLLYNMGNGFAGLASMSREKSGVDPDDPFLQQTKQAYRDAIAASAKGQDKHLLAEVYTNYGNALSACGRHFEALLTYDSALRIEPRHAMATGNKGIELERYAVIARNQSGMLLAEAYELCQAGAAAEILDGQGLAAARAVFAERRDALEPIYREWCRRLHAARQQKQAASELSDVENHHRRFAIEHNLYLNLCVHSWPCSEQHTDSLFFEYVAPIDDIHVFDRLARYFNQAKEDYATARYLLAEAIRPTRHRPIISDWTRYADLLEYADYGLSAGLAKAAFAGAFNILDKIAVFLKWELGLKDNETSIYFRKIWYDKREKAKLRKEIRDKNDMNLFALYDIALELGQPSYRRLGDIRRAITHRHLVSHEWLLMVGENSSEDEHILFDNLVSESVAMLKYAKAALIYLASYLSEEFQRRARGSGDLISPLPIVWQDEMR